MPRAFDPKGLPGGGAFDDLVKYRELYIGTFEKRKPAALLRFNPT